MHDGDSWTLILIRGASTVRCKEAKNEKKGGGSHIVAPQYSVPFSFQRG